MRDLIVRFQELERYDIVRDANTILFMALTPTGTFYSEVPQESARSVREARERFRGEVIDAMTAGESPRKVELGVH